MRNISAWAIRNPLPPIVFFVALTLAGIVSFIRMDVNNQPDVSFPLITVNVSQPGAAPSELETQVTQRVEAAVRGVSGVDEITAWATEGNTTVSVQFDIGTPVDRAVNDVRNAVSQIRGDLPDGILEPQVTRIDIEGGPLSYMSVESTDMTLEELSWFVDNTVAKRLLSVSGMAQVQRSGGVNREIRIVLDPAKLQSQGITAAQVNQQLRLVNINATGGRAEVAGAEQAVRVLGNSRNAYALGETQISVGNGRTVRLADIASVTDGYGEQRSLAKMNGRQVLSFSMSKAKGTSDVTVYDDAAKVLQALEKENPKIKFTELYTTVQYTKDQFKSAMEAMIEGAVLAVLVVWLFLRDTRATIISAIAIPLSAIPAFWFMDLMGFTLNGISLLALSLVAGVLVDDAIVEIENIVRHMRMGKSAYQASIDAADEIGLAVVATTLSIVAVFLPVGLMPGFSGQYFKQFGLTVVAAVLMSLAVARLITPMIAAYFLKAHGEASHGEGRSMDIYMRILRWTLDQRAADVRRKAPSRLTRFFAFTRDHRYWMMALGFLSFILTIFAYGSLPTAFQPTTDQDNSQVRIIMTPGTTLQQTQNVVDETVRRLRQEQEVQDAFADVQVGEATIYLKLRKDRERSSVDFERGAQPSLSEIPDARINFASQQGGGPSSRDIVQMFAGDDPDELYATATELVEQMKGIPEVRAPRIEGDMRRPEITVTPRFDLAADLGVTTQALSQTIRIATIGDIDQNVAKFSLSDRQIPIRVVIDESARQDLATIENLPVPTVNGGSVPLKVVADIGLGSGPTIIRRFNQKRRIVISADLAPGKVTGDAMGKINNLPLMKELPTGVEKVTFGQQKFMMEMLINFVVAVISGVLLVFAVLVLLYRKVLPPFVNMGSLLLAPLGGAVALHLTGNILSMPVFIGILMLLGIVAKNSILLIDFALEEIAKGVDKTTAIIDAGHKRAQPIVMTTVAMVAGMIPTALSLSGDAAWRAPMGLTVIGGLILSTLLTLLIIPAGFSLADDMERWLAPKFGKLTSGGAAKKPGGAAPQPAE
ncbi:efflux RND transporter permease subunit [Sphingoaurantiacus capsulatus]|uniref:Efflux RND transporter permease subunit n=1 Tax=Sphingoaurantiacus capsulatus TaxID=1771310 RepID=A0ABV7XBK3_9SPHN